MERGLIAEIENQIDAGPFNAGRQRAIGGAHALALRRGGLQTKEARELVFQDDFADLLAAELLLEAEEQRVADLLADGHDAAGAAGFGGGLDLEDIEVQGAAQRLRQ